MTGVNIPVYTLRSSGQAKEQTPCPSWDGEEMRVHVRRYSSGIFYQTGVF